MPFAGLIADTSGNLYGTASQGGGSRCSGTGCGTIFRLTPDGTFTVLHSFSGASDGEFPAANLLMDKKGDLYGTAGGGGPNDAGTVFKLSPNGSFKTLHAFAGGSDGANPQAGLIEDKAGDFYGTTRNGGGQGCNGAGCGTVFRLASNGTETVLYNFKGISDGSEPYGGVVADAGGNLYGTTIGGGNTDGDGVVFKVTPKGNESVPYTFAGPADGAWPEAGVILGRAGKLYGTTYGEGSDGWGTVFAVKK
ncbi:MAG TPA: choice-of-anchor tandem repeat GloVer-containing protein [Rhizomicrobium sp.]|jgi:uncharacterized repeat protein (TIGR03803 family)